VALRSYQIIQIMPAAPDWRAVFADESVEGLVLETQLIGWALIEREGGERAVVGLDATGEVESCESLENFLGYAAPGEPAALWYRDSVHYFHEHGGQAAGARLLRRARRGASAPLEAAEPPAKTRPRRTGVRA
jgi:hypothetical protein